MLTVLAVVVLVEDVRDWPFALLLVGVTVLIALRGVGAGINLQENELVLRDYLLTTRIRRAQIVSVERFPAIDWRSAGGVPRETLMWAFVRRAAMITAPTDSDRAHARSIVENWLLDGEERHHSSSDEAPS
ncbi:hypothetical protein [Curtobacterium sp. NPDC089185]|uniref:hypothetical protein n=1 Tax=Curtobacterium sp. NPDC089185 TaxID=3154968 RepID=UPI003432DE86